jgi:hypothetical protein
VNLRRDARNQRIFGVDMESINDDIREDATAAPIEATRRPIASHHSRASW